MNTVGPGEIQRGFRELLDASASRDAMIDYLARFPALLPLWIPRDNRIIRNLRVFDDEVADFACHRDDTTGELWRFIYVGDPGTTLRNKGKATSDVLEVIQKLRRWRDWFRQKLDACNHQSPFKDHEFASYDPEFFLILGRRSEIEDIQNHPRFENWSFLGDIDTDCIRPITFDNLLLNVTDQHWYKDRPLTVGHLQDGEFVTDRQLKVSRE